MRYKTRYDTWIVAVLVASMLLMVAMPFVMYASGAARGWDLCVFLFGPCIMLLVLFATLPQYYEVRDNGLFIRQGWKEALLHYASLRELRAATGVLSAPVFSTHRIYITASPGGEWIIAVADEDAFIAEVRSRAPQLQTAGRG